MHCQWDADSGQHYKCSKFDVTTGKLPSAEGNSGGAFLTTGDTFYKQIGSDFENKTAHTGTHAERAEQAGRSTTCRGRAHRCCR